MTNKQRILHMVERWPDDISYEEAIYRVYALKKIDEGLKSLESEPTIDHDELFDELERICDEEVAAQVVAASPRRSPSTTKMDRGRRRAKNGKVIRKQTKKVRGQAS
jgi:hypothetical protein